VLRAHPVVTRPPILTAITAVLVGLASCGHDATPLPGKPADLRYVLRQEAGVFVVAPSGVHARAEIAPAGMTLRGEAGPWRVSFRTVGYGCDGRLAPLERTGATASPSPGRVEFASSARGVGLSEWYEHVPAGIEHGFTLDRSPCETGPQITIEERLSGLSVQPRADGRGIDLLDGRHLARAHYTDLHATDARGAILPAWMEPREDGVALHVDARGAVFPVSVDPLVWFQTQKLIASDGAVASLFGATLALSGDTAIVGAPAAGGNVGEAYVFVESGGVWTEQQTLVPGDTAAFFGSAVALDGDTALVGAPGQPGSSGAAYVFVRSGTSWTLQQKIPSPANAPGFGVGAALAGTTALVAAGAFAPISGQGAAAVYVYSRSALPWPQVQMLQPSDGVPTDQFGFSLAFSGGTIAVSAQGAQIGSNLGQGAVYLFTQSGSGFSQQQKLVASDGAENDVFGQSVALDGSTLLVGAPQATINGHANQGAVYVFSETGGTFVQGQKLAQGTGAAGDEFGRSVALAGTTALIGSTREAASGGHAYVFSLGAGGWTQAQDLSASDGASGDQFGGFLAMSGTLALIGAPGATVGMNAQQGAAYVEALLSQAGDSCSADSTCGTGHCVDGVCCETACTSQCQACDVPGNAGICSTISGSPHQSHAPCASSGPGCGGTCDGSHPDVCTYPPGGTPCASTCSGDEETDSTCDGKGACVPGSPATCRNNLRCNAATGACYATCSESSQCAGGYVCAAGKCAPGAGCSDSHTSQGPTGAQDCRPYTCDGVTGRCNSACTTVDQCSAPSVCDFTGACVPPPDTSALPGGCAISPRRPAKAPVMPALASLAIAWAFRSRASRRARGRARAGSSS
jgi:hypothetical protein